MTIHPFALRLVVALVAASLSIVAARAETMAERVLAVVNAVCITPATPDDMTAAVQKTTEVSGWTLTHSAREHGVKSLGYSPLEPPLFVVQKRQIKDPAGATLDLHMIGPEYPDYRKDVCMLTVPGQALDDFVTEARKLLKPDAGESESRPDRTLTKWILTGDATQAEKGYKTLILSMRKTEEGWLTSAATLDVKSHNGELPPGTKF